MIGVSLWVPMFQRVTRVTRLVASAHFTTHSAFPATTPEKKSVMSSLEEGGAPGGGNRSGRVSGLDEDFFLSLDETAQILRMFDGIRVRRCTSTNQLDRVLKALVFQLLESTSLSKPFFSK